MTGTLYLCATPIGNLEDMTFRAVRILKEVDVVAAEDTRHTRKLLTHFDIHTPLVSYHEHNKLGRGPELIERLLAGESIACVSDAGMPGISDPGSHLAMLAIADNLVLHGNETTNRMGLQKFLGLERTTKRGTHGKPNRKMR